MRHGLICRLDNFGDVLLAGPAVRAVASGSDRVTFLCGPRGSEAARMLPGVDDVIVHRASWIDPAGHPVETVEITDLIESISSLGVTHALVLTSFHQSPLPTALLLRMAGVPVIAAISDDYPGSLLDVRHRVDPDLHEVERNLSLVATLGFRLPRGDDGLLHIAEPPPAALILPDRSFIAVHPGSTTLARTASPGLFAATVERLADDGWWVVVTGSPDETSLTSRVAGRRDGVLDLGGRTTLTQLATVLTAASTLVTGNSGPAHLAAAVGTPVVELFPPTVPAGRWHPWGVPHLLLGDQEISCAGCRAAVCPIPGQPCLGGVKPDEIVGAVRRVISNRDFLYPAATSRGVVA